jgi:hypothetical protein
VGVASFGCGAVAVFTTDNGTGAGALIAAGLILGLVGASGRLPLRGSIAGLDYDMTAQTAQVLVNALPRKQVAEIAESNESSPSLAEAARRRLEWYEAAKQAILRMAPEGADVELEAVVQDYRYDAVVSTADSALLIELHYGRLFQSAPVQIAKSLRLVGVNKTRTLVVTAAAQTSGERHVIWRSPKDDAVLGRALVSGLRPHMP